MSSNEKKKSNLVNYNKIEKFNIDAALDSIDMNFKKYTPSEESLEFFVLIRVFFGEDFEVPNPKFHYFIVDMLYGNVKRNDFPYSDTICETITINPSRIGIIATRGSAKSTVTTLFYPIICAIKGKTPVTGKLSHMLILSDSQQGGARDQALIMGNSFERSEFAKEWFEKIRFTETEVELIRSGSEPIEQRHMLIKFKGAQSGGIRSGSRNPVTGDRYAIIIADDVIKNEAEASSVTIMKNVTTALNSDALNAMRSKNTQLVLINTPFNKNDPIYRSVESGVFTPLVAPICKKISIDMTEDEFEPLWEEMHDFHSVMERYRNAVGGNSERSFNQELMLRIADEKSRLVRDEDMQWISRKLIEDQIGNYNIYITTDFTASNDKKGDFSGIFCWAVSANKDWFLIDMALKKMGIAEQYEPLFNMVRKWGYASSKTITVGIEIDGQQQLNIFALKKMMIEKNIYFTIGRQVGSQYGSEGISRRRSGGKKHEQFMRIHPMFQAGKIFFSEELKDCPDMKELLEELKYITYEGIGSKHDDGLDTLSMIGIMEVLYPIVNAQKLVKRKNSHQMWGFEDEGQNDISPMSGY